MKDRYSFSRDRGATPVSLMVSEELGARITSLCNIMEMSKSSLCRYLIQRGVGELEAKLVEMAEKERAAVAPEEAA